MSSNINSKENPSKKTVPCRFFASGFCVKGDLCPFSHDLNEAATLSPTNKSYTAPVIHPDIPISIKERSPPSSFYSPDAEGPIVLKNFADLKLTENRPATENISSKKYSETLSSNLKGANSKLLPSIRNGLSLTAEAPKSKELCIFALTGKCRYGIHCRNVHGMQCPRCLKFCLHPDDMEQNEEHIQVCLETPEVQEFEKEEHRLLECGICFEPILSKSDPRFGLLNCTHPFCISCIRNWRNKVALDTTNIRSCPLCRTVTYFVVPSAVWVTDPEEKKSIVEAYKKKMGEIPCRHFNQGRANCPFGSSCFYAHKNVDGEVEKAVLRTMIGENEKVNVMRETRLSDFINFK